MHRINRTGLCVGLGTALVLAFAIDLHAAPGGERFPIDVDELRIKAAAAFEGADADGDGVISAAEFAEAKPVRERRGRRGGGPGDGFDGDSFELGDADGDGALSQEEFEALPAARRAARAQRLFERLDADGDGGLSQSEFPSRAGRLAALDADGDGLLTREEMRQGRRGR